MSQPQAYIHPDAKIGPNVTIEPFAVIQGDVEIGEGSWIGSHAVICDGARIGKHCKIFPGAQIASEPQDLKFEGEVTTAHIGDYTQIREFVTVSRGTKDRHQTVIGQHCLLMAYAHVAHDCIVGDHCILANSVQLAGHVVAGNHVVFGGLVGVHQFVHIGDHVMLAGHTTARKDVPPFALAGREPLVFTGVNTIGLRRRGFSNETINQIQDIYRLMYGKGLNTTKAIPLIEEQIPDSEEKNTILEFLKQADRGIIRSGQ